MGTADRLVTSANELLEKLGDEYAELVDNAFHEYASKAEVLIRACFASSGEEHQEEQQNLMSAAFIKWVADLLGMAALVGSAVGATREQFNAAVDTAWKAAEEALEEEAALRQQHTGKDDVH